MKIYCEKCNKEMESTNFYTYKNGKKVELCKKCLTMHIDAFDESTFLWVLEKMDLPYIPAEWNVLRDKDYQVKGPIKFRSDAVFGKYLSKMKLNQWNKYGWADGPKLTEDAEYARKARAADQEIKNATYKEQYEQGNLTEAEYRTLVSTPAQREADMQRPPSSPYLGPDNPYDEKNFLREDELDYQINTLTREDKLYLAMKWGRLYKPEEWITLETMYSEMKKSFDIQDADSEHTLILSCKTDLKANQAIDQGDIEGFQKLSKVSESLRKSAKFTAAQNKEEKGDDYVDSIGQLVDMCEKQGFIPRFATNIPQDKVDQTLKDQKDYIYKLVTQDLGFGQQIEEALKKIEVQRQVEEEEKARIAALGDAYDPYYDMTTIEDQDQAELNEMISKQQEQDRSLMDQ